MNDNKIINLIRLGYTESEARKIVSHIPLKKIDQFISSHAVLIVNFSHAQIARIAGRGGGSRNIEAVRAAFTQLQVLGFNADHIVKIAGHNGGSKNIDALLKNYRILDMYHFKPDLLVKLIYAWSKDRERLVDLLSKRGVLLSTVLDNFEAVDAPDVLCESLDDSWIDELVENLDTQSAISSTSTSTSTGLLWSYPEKPAVDDGETSVNRKRSSQDQLGPSSKRVKMRA